MTVLPAPSIDLTVMSLLMTTRLDVESPEALVEPRLYVPGATSTVSPAEAAVTASWIVPNAVSSDSPVPDAP